MYFEQSTTFYDSDSGSSYAGYSASDEGSWASPANSEMDIESDSSTCNLYNTGDFDELFEMLFDCNDSENRGTMSAPSSPISAPRRFCAYRFLRLQCSHRCMECRLPIGSRQNIYVCYCQPAPHFWHLHCSKSSKANCPMFHIHSFEEGDVSVENSPTYVTSSIPALVSIDPNKGTQ